MPTLTKEKKTICPGCGKIEVKEDIIFLCEVLEGEIKEISKEDVSGLKWCNVCR